MKRSLVILVLGFIAGGIFFNQIDKTALLAQAKSDSEDKNQVYEQLNLFGEVFDRIRSGYVENVNSSDLISAAIRGMLTSLDPHSGYMPPESFQDMQVDTRGAFGGSRGQPSCCKGTQGFNFQSKLYNNFISPCLSPLSKSNNS